MYIFNKMLKLEFYLRNCIKLRLSVFFLRPGTELADLISVQH
jgi:hypothetical protein